MNLAEIGFTASGMVLALTPLALWVAPNTAAFGIILAVTMVAGATVWLFSVWHTGYARQTPGEPSAHRLATVPDRFVAELHKLSPMTYHHRSLGDRRYQRKIDPLKKFLEQ
ncbi:MAG: hypothetical protein QF384_14370 [Alphaproteobacteria bacterium]|jgi:hypothetical protein|nr:hypothetical protein [Alphaproteobacteria bacterium]